MGPRMIETPYDHIENMDAATEKKRDLYLLGADISSLVLDETDERIDLEMIRDKARVMYTGISDPPSQAKYVGEIDWVFVVNSLATHFGDIELDSEGYLISQVKNNEKLKWQNQN